MLSRVQISYEKDLGERRIEDHKQLAQGGVLPHL